MLVKFLSRMVEKAKGQGKSLPSNPHAADSKSIHSSEPHRHIREDEESSTSRKLVRRADERSVEESKGLRERDGSGGGGNCWSGGRGRCRRGKTSDQIG
jgi:hypothetical protein